MSFSINQCSMRCSIAGEIISRLIGGCAFEMAWRTRASAYVPAETHAVLVSFSQALLSVDGAGSCMGFGEATALRMMLAATGFLYGQEGVGIVAATGCNTVYTSTYPYNPCAVSWTN